MTDSEYQAPENGSGPVQDPAFILYWFVIFWLLFHKLTDLFIGFHYYKTTSWFQTKFLEKILAGTQFNRFIWSYVI